MRRVFEFASGSVARRGRVIPAAVVACLASLLAAGPALADVPWHTDVAQAKAASVISHRPVLVVFTAKWSEASVALEQSTLTNAEAMALVTACFEPVKIDVDADPETTRRLGVSYLPAACVIDLDDRVLASFDCPDNPASFVAAAGRAAQDAAAAKAAAQPGHVAAAVSPTLPRTTSDFSVTPASATPAIKQPEDTHAAAVAASTTTTTATAEPSLPTNPPAAWPAERAASPTATTASTALPAPATRPSIEPAPAPAAPQPAATASWLQQQSAAPSAPPASAPAPATAAAGTPPAAPTAPPAAEEKPKPTNAFIAALQKPFALLPKWPGTTTSKPTATPPATPATAAAQTDIYGSMPVGLEGYCPVTLQERGAWVEGRAQFGARHRGRTYLFAGTEQQQAFLADPDRYAPALSGDDPVLACDAGKSVPGQRRYGVTYQSRVFLFSSADTRTAFTADPLKYTARVALAEGRSPSSGTVQR